MKKYPEYKNSGIEWIGDIPSHWKVGRLKYYNTVIMGQSPSSNDYTDDIESIPFLQGNAEFGHTFPTPSVYCDVANKYSDTNDILISVRAPVGAINISDRKYGIGRGLAAVREQIRFKFNYFYLKFAKEYLESLATGSTFTAISVDDLKNLPYPIPTLKEQTAIANFLDLKTQQIDDLIDKKEQLIELLKEERTALINQAVTKGLNPDVPMKDSGIEWLGEIPEHWEISRIDYVSDVVDPQPDHRAPKIVEDGYPYVGIRDVNNDGSININSARKVSLEAVQKQENSFTIEDGDIVFCKVGTLGLPRFIIKPQRRFALSATLVLIKNFKKISNHFLIYSLQSNFIFHQLDSLATGSTRKALGIQVIRRFKFPKPSLSEQEQIANFLYQVTKEYEKQNFLIQKEIELLKEYKVSLINEAVTGKIDVRQESI